MKISTNCLWCGVFIVLSLAAVGGQRNEGDSCYESYFRTEGTCKRTNQCSTSYSVYLNYNHRFDICGYWFDQTIVCCVENFDKTQNRWPNGQTQAESFQPPTTTRRTSNNRPIWGSVQSTNPPTVRPPKPTTKPPSISQPANRRLSEEKCDEYSEGVTETIGVIPLLIDPDVTTFKQPKCDYLSNPLILGGNETEVGEFPHMAAIGWKKSSGSGYVWLCGGSLISERFVLTAGHCTFQSRNTDAESGRPAVVRLGDHDLREGVPDGAKPITVKIDSIIKNPGYKSPKKYHDVALLKLAYDVDFNSYVRPACLSLNEVANGEKVIATGWGTTSNKATTTSDVPRKVQLKVFTNAECQPNFVYNRNWKNGFSEDQMCAGDEQGGKDTCQGDSGGPLQVESPVNSCVFYIVGVTGFGGECGNPKGSGVYAIVSHYLDWIEDEVWVKNQ